MSAKNDISARFIEAFEALLTDGKVSDKKDFAAKIGISASMVTEISKGRSSVGISSVQNIVSQFNINADWLVSGRGEMLADGAHSEPVKPAARHTDNPKEGIPLIPIDAMAGALTGDFSVLDYECERYVVPAFKGADFLIRINGTSMTPSFRSGDIVACQRVPLSDIFFQWNRVYVIDTCQGALVKRIRPAANQQHVLIVSDNPDYAPFELPFNAIQSVALVVGTIRLE